MLKTMTINKKTLRAAAAKGFINATDCADYLVKKGVPFRDAYKSVGCLVRLCEETGKTLEDLTLEEYKTVSLLFEKDIYDAVNLENCVKERKVSGGPAPEAVLKQIKKAEAELNRKEHEK